MADQLTNSALAHLGFNYFHYRCLRNGHDIMSSLWKQLFDRDSQLNAYFVLHISGDRLASCQPLVNRFLGSVGHRSYAHDEFACRGYVWLAFCGFIMFWKGHSEDSLIFVFVELIVDMSRVYVNPPNYRA